MTTTAVATRVPGSPVAVTETEALELEGLVDITPEQLAKAKRIKVLRARKEAIEFEMDTLKKELKDDLVSNGLAGLMYRGRKFVGRKIVRKSFVNQGRLRSEFPEVAEAVTEIRTEVHLMVP